MSNALFIFCVPLRYIYTNTQKKWIIQSSLSGWIAVWCRITKWWSWMPTWNAWGWGCILKRYCFCENSRNTNMILTNWICWPISGELPWKICNILLRTSICFSLQRTGISDVCIWTRWWDIRVNFPSNVLLPVVREGEAVRKVRWKHLQKQLRLQRLQ